MPRDARARWRHPVARAAPTSITGLDPSSWRRSAMLSTWVEGGPESRWACCPKAQLAAKWPWTRCGRRPYNGLQRGRTDERRRPRRGARVRARAQRVPAGSVDAALDDLRHAVELFHALDDPMEGLAACVLASCCGRAGLLDEHHRSLDCASAVVTRLEERREDETAATLRGQIATARRSVPPRQPRGPAVAGGRRPSRSAGCGGHVQLSPGTGR